MLWLMNLVAFSVQLAVLVVAGAIVMTALRVDAPARVAALLADALRVALLWPLYQLWEGPTRCRAPRATAVVGGLRTFPERRRRRLRYRRADHDRRRHDCRVRRAHQAWLARDRADQAARDRCRGRIRRRPRGRSRRRCNMSWALGRHAILRRRPESCDDRVSASGRAAARLCSRARTGRTARRPLSRAHSCAATRLDRQR